MKIDNSGSAVAAYSGQSQQVRRDTSTPAAGSGSAPTDSVSINPLASSISALSAQADTTPAFDAAKVDAIKNAIAAGTFSVNPDKIADSLIASTQELLNQ